jgi:hypothetical protein
MAVVEAEQSTGVHTPHEAALLEQYRAEKGAERGPGAPA